MPAPSDPEAFRQLFIERTHHTPLLIGESDVVTGSRVGGRAPDRKELETAGLSEMTYFFTLGSDVLGSLIDSELELSFFYLRDQAARLNGTPGAEPDVLHGFPHGRSQRAGTERDFDSPLRGRSLQLGELTRDETQQGLVSLDTKLGGSPGLIQNEEIYFQQVRERNLSFLMQISEESFPSDMLTGSYLFYYGAVYLFTRFDEQQRRIDIEQMGSFWQH